MKIYESSVRKPISTILIFVGVIIFGLFSLKNLAIDQMPEMDFPAISVITVYNGANAGDIENNVTRILEDNLNTVNDLEELHSTSQDGTSIIFLEFEWGTNLDNASNDIRDVVGRVSGFLPEDAEDPIILRFSSSMAPILVLTVVADESYSALDKILEEQLVNRLNRVNGVGSVSVMGAPVREIQVNVDPRKMEAYGLTVEQIGGVIARENVNISGGSIDIGNNTFNVKADGEFNSSDDLYSVLISSAGGQEVYLRDVATIVDTLEKATLDERVNGQKGVRIVVQKQSGANTVGIVEEVQKMLPRIEAQFPVDIKMDILQDNSSDIQDSISSLSQTVMFAFLFVIVVVLFFLGRWRATLIICLTIPVSLVVSFIYLYVTGGTLNIMSLSSLSIAIGMVVDDAIVVLENITTHIDKGSKPKEAAIYGTNEVWLSVIATTLTVVAVFLPLTLVGGMAGIMFEQLGWIVSLVITVSTIAAITLTPMLSSLMLDTKIKGEYKGLGKIFKPIDKFLDKLDHSYEKMLRWSVRHKSLMFFIPLLLLIGSIFLFKTSISTEFMPMTDEGRMSAVVTLEQNLNVEYTTEIAREIDSVIYAKYPEVLILSTSAGAAPGSNIFAAMGNTGSNIINYTMRMATADERERSVFEIADLFREDLAQIPEIKEVSVTAGGGMGDATVSVDIFGYDFDITNAIAQDLKQKISRLEGARDVRLSRDDMRPEYNVSFDRNKLALYGLNSATVSSAIRNRISGMTAALYREDGEEYDIKVRYDEQFRTSLEDIKNIIVYTPQGNPIRVGDVSEIIEEFTPPKIQRNNRQRVLSVNVALGNKVPLGDMVNEIEKILKGYDLPDNVFVEIGGSNEDMQESFADIIILFILIVLLVYIVMATQFESLVMPFVIMFTILYALPGVILALYITSTPLSLVALIAAVMLVGIVVKNGIVMVDYTNLLRERGYSLNDAVTMAGKSRLRPVLMTSLTTILGMLPMAIGIGSGAEMWQPMGIAVIGGLVFSTVLTLLAVPALYGMFMKANERRRIGIERRKQAKLLKMKNKLK